MDLNVIFAISALGLFSMLTLFRMGHRIPIGAAMLCLAFAGIFIYLKHAALGNAMALAMFYLLMTGVLLYTLDHLAALRKRAKARCG